MSKKPFDNVYVGYDFFMKFWKLYKVDEFRSLLELSGDEIIADIGGGTGYIAKALLPYCATVYVIDQSEKMLSCIKKIPGIIPLCRDGGDTGLESHLADVIILSDVLHHIKDVHSLLKEIKRICKPGGTVLVQDFDITFLKTKLLRIFEGLLFGTLYFQTRDYFDTLLLAQDFKKEKEILSRFNYIQVWRNREAL